MNIDKVYSAEMPVWFQYHMGKLDTETTIQLEKYSELYKNKRKRKSEIYDKHFRLSQFIDGEIKDKNWVMAMNEARALAELIHIEFDIMEMYQYLYYLKGIRDGMELKDLAEKIKRIDEGGCYI